MELYNRILYDMFHSVQSLVPGFKGDNVKIKQIAKRVCLDLGDMKSGKRRNWIARAETFIQNSNYTLNLRIPKNIWSSKESFATMISMRSKLKLRRLRLKNNPTEMP